MKRGRYYAKSFEEDFVLKTLKGKEKVDSQTIDDILKTQTIRPNTKSFGRESRLACSILHPNYLKTYRSQGIIFTTNNAPDYVCPFDLVLLSTAKKIIAQYYRIKNDLHVYYNHELVPGFEQFIFKNIDEMLKKFPTLEKVWQEVNAFRVSAGLDKLPKSKHRLIEYNETIFHKPVRIAPVAIFGYTKLARDIARKYDLPCFRSAKIFFESLSETEN